MASELRTAPLNTVPARPEHSGVLPRFAGLGLIECLLVLALVMIAAAMAAPQLSEIIRLRQLESASWSVGNLLRHARLHLRQEQVPLRLDIHGNGSAQACLHLHTGRAGDCEGCVQASCRNGARLIARTPPLPRDIALKASTDSALWHPAGGTVTPTLTVRLQLNSESADPASPPREALHVVNILGRVRSCSSAALVSGHPPC